MCTLSRIRYRILSCVESSISSFLSKCPFISNAKETKCVSLGLYLLAITICALCTLEIIDGWKLRFIFLDLDLFYGSSKNFS